MYKVSPVRSNSLEMRRDGGLTATGATVFSVFPLTAVLSTAFFFASIRATVALTLGAPTARAAAAATAAVVVVLRVEARVTGLVTSVWFWGN